MKTLVLDLKGNFAHFRKFYANSTSLSYEFPPRTVLCGLFAGMLGFERDSYYEKFNEENTFLAVQILQPTKRISQTINYMWVKSSKDLNGSSGRMQIPVEWIVHEAGVGVGTLAYRIYFAHRDQTLYDQVAAYVRRGHAVYPPYMGITEALASIEYVGEAEAEEVQATGSLVEIATVCPIHLLQDITYPVIENGQRKMRIYMRDRIPCSFDSRRKLSGITQVIYEPRGKGIVACPKQSYVQLMIERTPVSILPMKSEGEGGGSLVFFPS